ncbi:dTDP-glucose pyrophosphorylase [Natrinema sp. J7-2]|nr:dTDP-glucose pyrophosphorylase [Natrinema sp. J7-2]
MVEVDGTPILTHCFDHLVSISIDADVSIVVIGYLKAKTIDHYGDAYESVPIHVLPPTRVTGTGSCAALRRGMHRRFHADVWDQCFQVNLEDVVQRRQEEQADAAFLVEK